MADKDFSWNLKKLRSEANLKQADLAKMTGISQKTLSSYETGRTEPNMGDATKIARALDCSLDKLAGNKAREVGDITYEDVLVKLRDLSYEELRELGSIAIDMSDQKYQMLEIEKMKEQQKKRYAAYERRIKELLEKGSDGDSE